MTIMQKRLAAGIGTFALILAITIFTDWGWSPAAWSAHRRFWVALALTAIPLYAACFPFSKSRR